MPPFTLFHVFYSTSFTLLFLILACLILIPPGDAIAQAYLRNKQLFNVFVIAGTYLLTALLALLIYISRIYTFRRLLAEIPKEYVPMRKVDLPNRVHSAVTSGLSRSALITVRTRPNQALGAWGTVNHPGWAPPGGELQGVQYVAVIKELSTVIETRAASINYGDKGIDSALPLVIARKRPDMTLRTYLDDLIILGLAPRNAVTVLLGIYEKARFGGAGRGIEEAQFRTLMDAFAAVLRGMDANMPHHPQTSIEPQDETNTHSTRALERAGLSDTISWIQTTANAV